MHPTAPPLLLCVALGPGGAPPTRPGDGGGVGPQGRGEGGCGGGGFAGHEAQAERGAVRTRGLERPPEDHQGGQRP